MLGGVVQDEQLVGAKRQLGVSAAVVVGEFDFIDAGGEQFHDSAYLATDEVVRWQIDGQRDDIKQLNYFRSRWHTHYYKT